MKTRTLVGWAEIAKYLRRTPRTLKTYHARRGLPLTFIPTLSTRDFYAWLAAGRGR